MLMVARAAWLDPERRVRGLFVILLVLVTILSIDIEGVWRRPNPPPRADTSWENASGEERALLTRQYDAVVQEIRLRIGHDQELFGLKFVLVGGILLILFPRNKEVSGDVERTKITALVAWASVVTAAIIDLRIAANQAFIVTLGGWVTDHEGLVLSSLSGRGWESYLARHLIEDSWYPALRVSGQVLTVLLFAVAAVLFLLSGRKPLDSHTRMVTAAGGLISIVLMMVAAVSRSEAGMATAIYVVSSGAACSLMFWLSNRG
jgi:hypothetical protein